MKAFTLWSSIRPNCTELSLLLTTQVDPSGGHPIAQTPGIIGVDPESESWESDAEDDLDNLECYPKGAPSILSSKYLAAQGSRITLGATRRTGMTAEEAFQASFSNKIV